MKWKKTHAILIFSTLLMTACTTSVGVGTGFHLGGLGVGVSTSTPIKKEKIKTTEEVANEALQESKNQEKAQ